MARKLVQPPITASHVPLPTPRPITKMILRTHRTSPATLPLTKSSPFGDCPSASRPIYTIRVQEQNSNIVEEDNEIEDEYEGSVENMTLNQIKIDLYKAIEGINRGIFGVTSAKKAVIEDLVKLLETRNPNPDPTLHLDKLGGRWKLVYSTITILGSKRTKLGLRDFISLGDFFQTIDIAEGKAINTIRFNVRGLNLFNGQLTIEASFEIASRRRVTISYVSSTITPDQLMNLFLKNYDLLLGIFNPEGWLEITYVDDSLRIGRDDKGNIFILERS